MEEIIVLFEDLSLLHLVMLFLTLRQRNPPPSHHSTYLLSTEYQRVLLGIRLHPGSHSILQSNLSSIHSTTIDGYYVLGFVLGLALVLQQPTCYHSCLHNPFLKMIFKKESVDDPLRYRKIESHYFTFLETF